MERRRYALRLAYDGRAFRGFQRQPGLATVQEAVEAALARAGADARVQPAARTDAGVSALDKVVTFSLRADFDPADLRAAVNLATPGSILCLGAAAVPRSFHARASALSRRYTYLVATGPVGDLAPWCWSLPDPRAFPDSGGAALDLGRLTRALEQATGTHDFAGFARGDAAPRTVRTVRRVTVARAAAAPLIAIGIEADGFLRAMVRNLVGCAVTIGLGLEPPGTVSSLLESPSRYRGVRAPGWGLTLVEVSYPPGWLEWV